MSVCPCMYIHNLITWLISQHIHSWFQISFKPFSITFQSFCLSSSQEPLKCLFLNSSCELHCLDPVDDELLLHVAAWLMAAETCSQDWLLLLSLQQLQRSGCNNCNRLQGSNLPFWRITRSTFFWESCYKTGSDSFNYLLIQF